MAFATSELAVSREQLPFAELFETRRQRRMIRDVNRQVHELLTGVRDSESACCRAVVPSRRGWILHHI